MFSIYQKTLEHKISFNGVGLHSGKNSNVKLIPAYDNQGIFFKRVDLENNNLIEAKFNNVSSATLCTTLKNNHGVQVSTVEHLLAALYIKGIDNLTIEIDSEEMPILDGSSKEFINLIESANTTNLNTKKKYIKILDKVEFEDNGRKISIEPSENFEVDFQLSYENNIIGLQRNKVNFFKDNLEKVTQSRTFCLFDDIEKIKKMGFAKGGSLDNAIVVENNKILNQGGLRNEKEFVNHKILDLVGDFSLLGFGILGKVTCDRGGHELSNLFLHELMNKNKNKFEILTVQNIKSKALSHRSYTSGLAVNA